MDTSIGLLGPRLKRVLRSRQVSEKPVEVRPIAQNRIAHVFAAGRGMPADPVEAIKWHLISKEGGASDQKLDAFMRSQKPEILAAATKAAQPSIEALRLAREPRS